MKKLIALLLLLVAPFAFGQVVEQKTPVGAGSGTVTSVGISLPAGLSVSGSPVTTAGTLNVTTALTGPVKGTGSGFANAAAADIVGLFSTCSGTQYLGADGACHNGGGGGTPGGTSGQLQYNNSGSFGGFTVSGDCTVVVSTGVWTCTATNGTAFGTFATQNFATPPAIGGTTPAAGAFTTLGATGNLTTNVTGLTQCLHASSSGVVSGTGSDCGSGGSTAFSGLTSGTNTTAAMLVGTGGSLATTGTGTITPSAISLTATGAGGVVASGTSGQIYTSAGGSSAPTWQSGVALTGLTADTTPAAGDLYLIYSQAATATESITGTVLFGSPPPIGATTAAAGNFTTLGATGNLTTNVTGSTQCLQVNTSGVVSGSGGACGGGGSPAFSAITSGTNTTAGMVVGTGATFKILGSSTGGVTLASADAGATNYTLTFPNATDTAAVLGTAQTFTALQSFNDVALSPNALSAASWTTNGLVISGTAQTLTDTTGTGTITRETAAALPAYTIAATNAGVTVTNLDELYLPAPVAGTNVTGTNKYSLDTAGAVNFGGSINGAAGATLVGNIGINQSGSSGFNTNIMTGTTNGAVALGGSGSSVSINGVASSSSTFQFSSHLLFSGAAPTISSGFGTSPSISHNNGTLSFSVNVGTGGSATSGVIGLPTAANAWSCWASDTGATPTGQTEPTAGTTTTITLTNYSRTTGTPVAWTASEIIQVGCAGN